MYFLRLVLTTVKQISRLVLKSPFFLQRLKTLLPRSVTVVNGSGRLGEQVDIVRQQSSGEYRLSRSRWPHDQQAAWGTKLKGCRT